MSSELPLPGRTEAVVAVPPPAPGRGSWVGAPSAALGEDGAILLAYRVRVVDRDVAETVVARSADGEAFSTLGTIDRERFGAHSMERPALVQTPDGRWRLYVCLASGDWPRSKHWWVEVLEADDPSGLPRAEPRAVFPGDERTALKDPVIRWEEGRWLAWICVHPLEERDEEDRMSTALATSRDGIDWAWHGTVLEGRAGSWDARGARVTAILPGGHVAYDGRATKEENFSERTGLARRSGSDLVPVGDEPVADARYLEVLPLPGGAVRIFYEAPLPDESHELRTELFEPGSIRSG